MYRRERPPARVAYVVSARVRAMRFARYAPRAAMMLFREMMFADERLRALEHDAAGPLFDACRHAAAPC